MIDYDDADIRWQKDAGPGSDDSLLRYYEMGDQDVYLYQEQNSEFAVGDKDDAKSTGRFVLTFQ